MRWKVYFIMFVIFSNCILYTSNQENTKHIHNITDTCTDVHFPPAHPDAATRITLWHFMQQNHSSFTLNLNLNNLHFKTRFKSENMGDRRTFNGVLLRFFSAYGWFRCLGRYMRLGVGWSSPYVNEPTAELAQAAAPQTKLFTKLWSYQLARHDINTIVA